MPEVVVIPDFIHDYVVIAEHDGGYVLVKCRLCNTVDIDTPAKKEN